jgi:hypothetical protein
MSSRVFVVQEPLRRTPNGVMPRYDYATITPYGDMVFLFTWGQLKEEDCLAPSAMPTLMRQLRERLADFSDNDYLLPVGNPALCAMAAMVCGDVNEGRVRILDWQRNEREYREVQIDLDADLARRA